jgi:lipopolysaccharide transport system ATP-binding protein
VKTPETTIDALLAAGSPAGATSEVAIEVRDVAKVYRLYDHPMDRVKEAFDPLRRRFHRDFPALRGVSLHVCRGETVGIVGRNGSGKSTLLKIITRVAAPTQGSVMVNGRVSALLELGTGFNPELTGIENIYFSGTLLGYRREQVEAKLPDILRFADIGDFVQQPIKSYSSGMLGRLGFAVAAAFDPDVLIVDEALAVGDEAFQRKCFARIKAIQEQGAAVLFVSHSAGAVIELCDRAVLMDQGEILMQGLPKAVVAQYHRLIFAAPEQVPVIREAIRSGAVPNGSPAVAEASQPQNSPARPASEPEIPDESYFDENLCTRSLVEWPQRGARILDPHVETVAGRRVNVLERNREYVYTYEVEFAEAAFHVGFGMMLKTVVGYELGGATTINGAECIEYFPEGARAKVCFRFRTLLAPGTYFLNAGVLGAEQGAEVYLHRLIDACLFRVQAAENDGMTGVADFLIRPNVSICRADVVPCGSVTHLARVA